MTEVLSGCTVHAELQKRRIACEMKHTFEAYIRELLRPFIGDDADEYTELDYVSDLAEDGWPDYGKWLAIFERVYDGGELTPREREQAIAYYQTDDTEDVAEEYRLA